MDPLAAARMREEQAKLLAAGYPGGFPGAPSGFAPPLHYPPTAGPAPAPAVMIR